MLYCSLFVRLCRTKGVRAVRHGGPPLSGVLVGNKCEFRDGTVDSRAEVAREDGERFASELGLAYFESSAVRKVVMVMQNITVVLIMM